MTELAVINQSLELAEDKVALIKRTIAKGASDDELELFIAVCNRMRLDPFAKQIYLVPRYDKDLKRFVFQPQVSIDAARLTAQRSHEYEGQDPIEWCGKDGVWTDIWLKDEHPAAARATVHRAGFQKPMTAVATWDTYVQTYVGKDGKTHLQGFWSKGNGSLMIGKCAEMLALRKAFPMELSGVYIAEELDAAFGPPVEEPKTRKTSQKAVTETVTRQPPQLQAVEASDPEIIEAEIVEAKSEPVKEEKHPAWVKALHIQAGDLEDKIGLPGELVLDAAVLHVVGGTDPSTTAIKDRVQANAVAKILTDLALGRGSLFAKAHIEDDREWYTIEEDA